MSINSTHVRVSVSLLLLFFLPEIVNDELQYFFFHIHEKHIDRMKERIIILEFIMIETDMIVVIEITSIYSSSLLSNANERKEIIKEKQNQRKH